MTREHKAATLALDQMAAAGVRDASAQAGQGMKRQARGLQFAAHFICLLS